MTDLTDDLTNLRLERLRRVLNASDDTSALGLIDLAITAISTLSARHPAHVESPHANALRNLRSGGRPESDAPGDVSRGTKGAGRVELGAGASESIESAIRSEGDGSQAKRDSVLRPGGEAGVQDRRDLTIRELQTTLPWTVHYHRDFRASPMTHKDFGHALLHVTKACGKLASLVNDAEHGGSDFHAPDVDRYVADLVVCALRMANTCPGRIIDLQRAVEERIETKNQMELRGEKQ